MRNFLHSVIHLLDTEQLDAFRLLTILQIPILTIR